VPQGLHTAVLSSYIGGMQEGSQKPRHKLYGGIAASVALHVIIAVALFVRLPAAEMQPPQEESVSVEIVPPPEEQPDEEKPAEQEQALNLTMPEQKPEEQQAPPPEPENKPTEEAKAEPPPPPPAPEEKVEAEQPPPAEPPPPIEEQANEKPPQAPPSEPAPADQPQNNEPQEANGRPLPVLRPVFEFGENSKGSGVSTDGNAAEEGEVAKAEDRDPEIPPEAAEETSEAAASEAEPEAKAETGVAAPALPQDVAPPSLETAHADPLATSDDGTIEGILADIAAEPVEKPPEKEKPVEDEASKAKPMKEAKRLFSQTDTSDASATTAMANIPRGVRASQLCTTELREQLRHGSPAYQPEILPSYSLPQGNVLDIRSAAFRAGAQWYDVRFRCEIDDGATKVVSFGLEVGGAVPHNQWKARRFPEF